MTDVSTPAQARIRIAIKDALGATGTITKLTHEKNVMHIEIVAPLGVQSALAKAEKAVEEIGETLKTEGVTIVHINGKPFWKAGE